MQDVLVIGGGVIGLSIAWELVQQGRSVSVVDQGRPGREASWAGAGILPPGHPGDSPLGPLCRATNELWPQLSAQLRERTGIDNGFQRCGGLEFASRPDGCAAEAAAWRATGTAVELLTPADVRRLEPRVCSGDSAAYLLPDLCQVRNPRHLQALIQACLDSGVTFHSEQRVVGFRRTETKITAVLTPEGELKAAQVVVAAGAWSRMLLDELGWSIDVEPVRGQIVLLQMAAPPFRRVIEVGPRYLVPRSDGRILVGATEEWVGFQKQNTDEAVAGLMEFATTLVPHLASAEFEQAWSGLRPHAPRGLPYLGRVPAVDNLYVAAGHFRAGLHLSPITARLIRQLLCDEPIELPLEAFSPSLY